MSGVVVALDELDDVVILSNRPCNDPTCTREATFSWHGWGVSEFFCRDHNPTPDVWVEAHAPAFSGGAA